MLGEGALEDCLESSPWLPAGGFSCFVWLFIIISDLLEFLGESDVQMEEFSFTNNKNSFFDGGNPLLPTPNWGDNIRCNLKMIVSRQERELPDYCCFFAGTLSRLTVRMHEEDNDKRSKCQLAAFFFFFPHLQVFSERSRPMIYSVQMMCCAS